MPGDLERRVAALEARITSQGEATVPTYLLVDPTTGIVTGVFSGGVQMPEKIILAPLSIAAGGRIGFTGSDGVVRQFITTIPTGAAGPGDAHVLDMESFSDLLDIAFLQLRSVEGGASGDSRVTVGVGSTANVAGATRVVIRDDTSSDFHQNFTAVAATPAIVMGTPRQPNAIRPTFVMLVIDTVAAGGFCRLLMDTANPPLTVIGQFFDAGARAVLPVSFIVPAANWYEMTIGGGAPTVLTAFEWTI